ncbi:hypothetical protein B0H19DRAFT_1160199 [Mycena capillaripes]|nr:hypothetical protein B0H19DRAFT_1160199 [Mycena capillaripes]
MQRGHLEEKRDRLACTGAGMRPMPAACDRPELELPAKNRLSCGSGCLVLKYCCNKCPKLNWSTGHKNAF